MKIGIITDSIDFAKGFGGDGISIYTRNIVEQLLKIDKKNKYVLIHYEKNQDPIYKLTEELIIPMPKIPAGREMRKIFLMPPILEKHKFDIIHDTTNTGPFFTKTKYKQVLTLMDIIPKLYPQWCRKMSSLYFNIGLPVVLKNVDKIITISYNSLRDIKYLECINDDSKVSFSYIGCKKYKTKKTKQKPYILVVGTIEPRKNHNRIIQAFYESKLYNKYDLKIAGSKGWIEKDCYELPLKLGIDKHVQFIHGSTNEEIANFYRNAEMLVFASIYEGFGLPILEAMSYGCPVISSYNTSCPEVGGDAVYYVNPEIVKEISVGMKKIATNKKYRKDLIKKGYVQAKKFSWKEHAEHVLSKYEELK